MRNLPRKRIKKEWPVGIAPTSNISPELLRYVAAAFAGSLYSKYHKQVWRQIRLPSLNVRGENGGNIT